MGKRANCQVLVSLTLAKGGVPVPVGLRLFLPEAWAADAVRCARAGVPEEHRRTLAKTDLALEGIDRVPAAGARFGHVLADAGHGMSAASRKGLSGRGLAWAVGIPRVQDVCASTVELRWPRAATGRPRKHPVPSEGPVAAEVMPENAAWRRVSWRRGTMIGGADHPLPQGRGRRRPRGGPLAAGFAALRVRPGRGRAASRRPPPARGGGLARRRAPDHGRAEVLPPQLAGRRDARGTGGGHQGALGLRAGAHQQLKGELGLGHFEGRSWVGLRRHALMAMTAFAFLQHLRLGERGEKRGRTAGTATTTDPARGPALAARALPRRPDLLPQLRG